MRPNTKEDEIRASELKKLHDLIDEQIDTRQHRLKQAHVEADSTRHWKLLVGAIEAAFVKHLDWDEVRATQMKRQGNC